MQLTVELKNDALKFQPWIPGTYYLSDKVNGGPSWTFYGKYGKAIWYYPEYDDWAIGNQEKLGTNIRALTSFGAQGAYDVFNVPADKWRVWDNDEKTWKNVRSGDVVINCEGACATVYEHRNYEGFSLEIPFNQFVNFPPVFDKKLSSVKVESGCELELYENYSDTGSQIYSYREDLFVVAKWHNDRASGARCRWVGRGAPVDTLVGNSASNQGATTLVGAAYRDGRYSNPCRWVQRNGNWRCRYRG